MIINPQNLKNLLNNQAVGCALDVHTKDGNIRTEAGEYLYKIKYKYQKNLCPNLAKVLTAFITDNYKNIFSKFPPLEYFDYILPVPPSDMNRDFQPVEEIARYLSQYTKIPLLNKKIFQKVRNTPKIKDLPLIENAEKILEGAFSVKHPEEIKSKHILIFDDIIGKGTTIREIIKTLKNEASISGIFVLCVTATRTENGLRKY